MTKMMQNLIRFLAAGALAHGAWAQTTYENYFMSESFPLAAPAGTEDAWTLDTGNQTLNNVIGGGGGSRTRTAGVNLAGWDSANFLITTEFTVNSFAPNVWVGLVALGTGAESRGYLADYKLSGGGGVGTTGDLRILRVDGSGTAFTETLSTGIAGVAGNKYRFEYAGVYTGAGLVLTFSVYDITGTPSLIGTLSTSADAAPLTDPYFGLRNRTFAAGSSLDVDFDFFAVVPEPSVVGLLTGMAALGLVCFRRRRRV